MFVCKICKEKYSSLEGLYSHLEEEHSAQIPPDMSTAHFYYYLKTGREHGNCVMCKQPTTFNEKTKKYNRFCNDPACKIKYKEIVDKRMIGVYGKVNLLNDPDHQRKMLMNRSISGVYNFKGVNKPYVGSYELDFLKTMDLFFDWDPSDIVSPSPHTYYYVYEGEKHFYIPDFYIMSLGLEIEVKDGGDNPNMHHKIQDVDKEKEKLKDKVMHTQKINHYIKLTNKNYYNLFEFFRISKEYVEKYGDYEKIPKIILDEDIKSKNISSSSKSKMNKEVNKAVNESYVSDVDILKLNDYEPVEEGYVFSKDNLYINFEKFESGKSNICLITGLSGSGKSTLGKQLANKYHAEYVELDTFYNIGTVSYEDLSGTIYKEYADENKKDYEWLVTKKISMNQIPNDLVRRMVQWVIRYCKKNKNKKYILEGVQIYSHGDAKVIKNEPLILINASMIKSIYQRHKREDSNNVNWKTQLKELPEIVRWYVDDEKQYNKFKKEIVEEGYSINGFKKIDISEESIKKYKSSCKGLSHIRTGKDYEGKIFIDPNNDVVGFYNLRKSDHYIQGIEINKKYQSKGLGKMLLQECINSGAERLSVNKNNIKAINMYKKDFKIVNEDKTMYYMELKNNNKIHVEESFVIDHLKKHIDKKSFNQHLKNMVIINSEDFNKYNNEISKCVKSIQTLLKQAIPGCVFDDSKITHTTTDENGYEFNMYFMTFLSMNEKNFKKFANKSKNKNIRNANTAKDCAKDLRTDIENRIIKLIRKLGFKEDKEYSQLASTKFINGHRFITIDVTDSLHCEINLDASFVIKKDIIEESYVCFPLLNSIISSKYDDVKSKEQYKRDVNAFKQHFLKGISRVDDIDDAKAMKGDLQALTSYLNGIKYTNNYSDFKNIDAVKEIEAWMCRVAIPELDLKINRYSKNLEPVNEYAHNITFAINNNIQRGIFGMMDDISSITIDDSIQLKRKNTVMQIITENLEYDDNTTIIKFGTDNDVSLSNDSNTNIGSYLNWNKNNGINALLKNVSDELFNSKISVEDFHKIEGGDE